VRKGWRWNACPHRSGVLCRGQLKIKPRLSLCSYNCFSVQRPCPCRLVGHHAQLPVDTRRDVEKGDTANQPQAERGVHDIERRPPISCIPPLLVGKTKIADVPRDEYARHTRESALLEASKRHSSMGSPSRTNAADHCHHAAIPGWRLKAALRLGPDVLDMHSGACVSLLLCMLTGNWGQYKQAITPYCNWSRPLSSP
jgi:hypothetical protein